MAEPPGHKSPRSVRRHKVAPSGLPDLYAMICVRPSQKVQGSLPSDLSLREGSKKAIAEGACALERSPMKWQHPILLFVGPCGAGWGFLYRIFPLLEENPLLDLVGFHTPLFLQTGF